MPYVSGPARLIHAFDPAVLKLTRQPGQMGERLFRALNADFVRVNRLRTVRMRPRTTAALILPVGRVLFTVTRFKYSNVY